MRTRNPNPKELGDCYLNSISENIESSRHLLTDFLNLTDYLDFLEETSENHIGASVEAMIGRGALNAESIRNMLHQFDEDQINAFAVGYIALQRVAAAKEVLDGHELVLDPSVIRWEDPEARITVLEASSVRLHRSWRPINSPYDDMYSAKFLDIGKCESGIVDCLDSTPSHGGIIQLKASNRLYPYHTISGLVNPETGEANVSLEIISL